MAHYTRALRPWMLVLVLNVIYLGAIFFSNNADAYEFVTLGDCFRGCNGTDGTQCAAGTEGYDGQFVYYIARDPLGSPDCLDVPAYRMQRILLPLLARALTWGYGPLLPWVLVLINLAALVAGTALLEQVLIAEHASRWYALTYGLFYGLFAAVRLSTTEALAYMLVIAALAFFQRGRLILAALMLGLAGFTKEMTGLFAAGMLLYFVLNHRWRDAVRLTLIAGVPFLVWQGVLYGWLGEFGAGSGGANASSFELIPFAGVIKIWTEGSLAIFLILGVLMIVPAVVFPTLWALSHAVGDLHRRHWELFTCLLLINAAIMPFVPFSTYREFLGLLRFMPGLVLAVMLYSAHEKLRRPLLYTTLWIPLIFFVVAG